MTKQEQIYNWLTIGIQQPMNRLSEFFYFDKRDNEFFSILVTDLFIIDENLKVDKDTTTTYTKEILDILIDRIKRIEDKDVSIISLPRLGSTAYLNNKDLLSQQIENFIYSNSIDTETATIWEIEEIGTITIDLKNESKPMIKKPWWKVWK